MSVHFKRNSCDIMVSQRCCVLSNVIWTYFRHFLRCSCAKFIKKIVDVWTLVAQQLFAWPRHVLCRTTLLYKVVWLNCCPCGCTLRMQSLGFARMDSEEARLSGISLRELDSWIASYEFKNEGIGQWASGSESWGPNGNPSRKKKKNLLSVCQAWWSAQRII